MKQEITTSGGTYVVTFTQAGTVEADRNNRTYILATATEAGQVAFKAISDSVIISDDNAILTAEDFVFAPGPILKPTSGGGETQAYVTWAGDNNSEVTLNIPDAVDLPLSFYERNITKVSGTGGGITNCVYMFYDCSSLTSLTLDFPLATNCSSMCNACSNLKSLTLDLPLATNCSNMCDSCTNLANSEVKIPLATNCSYMFYNCPNLKSLTLDLPSATNCNGICSGCSSLTSLTLDLPSATNCSYMLSDCSSLKSLTLDLPSATNCYGICSGCSSLTSLTLDSPLATNCSYMLSDCSSLTSLSFNFGSMATIDFTSKRGNGGLGNITTLQNVTVLGGGLASCTSFNVSTSTSLTDESIQNIIDALPDYSGTGTSALVTFPAGRLTAEQQAQLAAKNWTWS